MNYKFKKLVSVISGERVRVNLGGGGNDPDCVGDGSGGRYLFGGDTGGGYSNSNSKEIKW